MKFIHFADSHLDMKYTSLEANLEEQKKRKLSQKNALKKAFDCAREEQVDAIFISGDLFEQKYVSEDTINYIDNCFKELPNVEIFITPGNHDPLIKTSPYLTHSWTSNVHIFGSRAEAYEIGDVNIFGFGFSNYEMDADIVSSIDVEDSKINVLITHGTLDGADHKYNDIKTNELSKFDYVALGHIHMPKIDNSKIIYPGSLCSCGFDEPGKHGFILGDIKYTDENKSQIDLKLKFCEVEQKKFETIKFDISDCNSCSQVIDKLNLKDDYYKIILEGTRAIDINELKTALYTSNVCVCEVEDKTHSSYNYAEIAKQNTLKGIFTKKMLNKIADHPNDKEKVEAAIELVYKYL